MVMGAWKMLGFRDAGKVPTTRWSTVIAAGQDDTDARQQALAELCKMYWVPVYYFICARGRSSENARDLTQGFFMTQLLEKSDVAAADPKRGKFRSWLLTAVKNFLANDLAMHTAIKRHPSTVVISIDAPAADGRKAPAKAKVKKRHFVAPLISIDAPDAEGRCPVLPGDQNTPERIYERRWALTILERALGKLQESYVKRGQGVLFDKMKPLLVDVGAVRHRVIAEELKMTEEAFNVAVYRCRDRFHDFMRAEIAETVSDEHDIDDEMRFLQAALRAR
jgi:DNA-directed RNA polymerase specialized sigma24 family protein